MPPSEANDRASKTPRTIVDSSRKMPTANPIDETVNSRLNRINPPNRSGESDGSTREMTSCMEPHPPPFEKVRDDQDHADEGKRDGPDLPSLEGESLGGR
jgi:hypothetical protein